MKFAIIDLVDLLEKRNHFAKELSTGQLKRLEMARAMATNPKILMIFYVMTKMFGGSMFLYQASRAALQI